MMTQFCVAWWHQAITWTSVDSSSARSSDIHPRAIAQETHQQSVGKIRLKIDYLKFRSNHPGANELMWGGAVSSGMVVVLLVV